MDSLEKSQSDETVERALTAVTGAQVLERLKKYDPQIVSTIFVGLDIEGSDIDVICTYADKGDFIAAVKSFYGGAERFSLHIREDHVVSRFYRDGFQFEIYGSLVPVRKQAAYQHYRVMKRLVAMGGVRFRQAVRARKRSGLKTEPAIASLLDLAGDPYAAVLSLNNCPDEELQGYLKRA